MQGQMGQFPFLLEKCKTYANFEKTARQSAYKNQLLEESALNFRSKYVYNWVEKTTFQNWASKPEQSSLISSPVVVYIIAVVPKLSWTATQIKVAVMSYITPNKIFLHFLSKISFAVIARNKEQQYGFGSALPPK